MVICDPPSFAPNKASVAKAQASYERLFEMSARVTARWAAVAVLRVVGGGVQGSGIDGSRRSGVHPSHMAAAPQASCRALQGPGQK